MIADHGSVERAIANARIVPVVALERVADALPLCAALKAGGLQVAEITFRTAAARDAIQAISEAYPDFLVGAGTVTRVEEVGEALAAGARFAVAPGLNPIILQRAQEVGLPFFPGVCTPSDIEAGLQHKVSLLKFFPAEASGGIAMLNALYAPYSHRDVRFIPTGGITLKNMQEYLRHPAVVAIGGSWLVSKSLIADQNWDEIERLTREAVACTLIR